jgi:hypothetical protein
MDLHFFIFEKIFYVKHLIASMYLGNLVRNYWMSKLYDKYDKSYTFWSLKLIKFLMS